MKYLPKDLLPEFKLNISNISMEFKVTGNQWVCTCHNLWLIEVVKNLNNDEKVDADCYSPPDFKAKALTDLDQNALPCEYDNQFDPKLMDFGLPSANSKRYYIFCIFKKSSIYNIFLISRIFFHQK